MTPPSRLVWTNEESDEAPVTTLIFEDHGERTLLTLSEHYRYAEPPLDADAGMQVIMAEKFAQLDQILVSLPRPTQRLSAP